MKRKYAIVNYRTSEESYSGELVELSIVLIDDKESTSFRELIKPVGSISPMASMEHFLTNDSTAVANAKDDSFLLMLLKELVAREEVVVVCSDLSKMLSLTDLQLSNLLCGFIDINEHLGEGDEVNPNKLRFLKYKHELFKEEAHEASLLGLYDLISSDLLSESITLKLFIRNVLKTGKKLNDIIKTAS